MRHAYILFTYFTVANRTMSAHKKEGENNEILLGIRLLSQTNKTMSDLSLDASIMSFVHAA